jgi:2-polyprenyl-6-hydroxyphenyl methylase/3-demethylubiquinone-9 3-methyltransferase
LSSSTDEELRFAFGRNWLDYLQTLDEERVGESIRALTSLLRRESLEGCRFLDIGSGSGLSSLAAYRLGATVHSFDYDAKSVAATQILKSREKATDRWTVEQGSVLDSEYIARLGAWDIVYSWGVLHHTGAMWKAIDSAAVAVAPGGLFALAIYNDQGRLSRYWRRIKQLYVQRPLLRPVLIAVTLAMTWGPTFAVELIKLRPGARWRAYKKHRGMAAWHDVIDWVGGYPFEVASPDAVFQFLKARGYELENLVTRQGLGCNEYLFRKSG